MQINNYSHNANTIIKVIGMFLSLLCSSGCSMFGIRNTETPDYKVLAKNGTQEIRQYKPYIVATTTVSSLDYKASQNKAFKKLAGYIFGDNNKQIKIAMTAPVMQSQINGKWTMSFMMPAKYSLNNLPAPKDKSIALRKVPSRYYGVIRYSWLDSSQKNQAMADTLSKWLAKNSGFKIISGPVFAGYDPPWTIPFLRRNEVMFELEKV
jgi:hypothetical protein